MKVCGACKIPRESSEFHKNRKKPDGLRDKCKPCSRLYHHEHYVRNKQVYISKAKALEKELQNIVVEAKSKPCADCSILHPHWIMQFDHVEDNKVADVSNLVKMGSRRKLLEEIAKCEVVCANCHANRTYLRRVSTGDSSNREDAPLLTETM